MDAETIKYFSTLGVGGIIAGFMFLIYRQDHTRVVELHARSTQREDLLVSILQRNAVANEALAQTITAMMAQTQTISNQQGNDMRLLLERLLDAKNLPGR